MRDKYCIGEDMWSESRSQYGEIQRGHLQLGRPRSADFHRTVQIMQRRPDYDRGGGAISRDYRCYAHSEDYREYSDVREFGHGRVFGPSLKTGSWGDENSRWPRNSGSRQADYRDNSRRSTYYSSQFTRERSPHKREVSFYREESPHNRSGSSTSSRSYSPEKGKQPPSYQSQFNRNKERSVCALVPSRDASPSISIPPTSSKSANFEKGSKTSDNLNEEIVNEWSSEQQQIPELEIAEHNKGDAVQMLLPENLDYPELSTPGPIDNIDLGQTDHRTRTIAEKAKEIEEVYRQDCETFGMVVQMLINKDPSLENTVQFALRENLREIEDRCIEELKRFITQYDSAPGDNTANL
ncbi:periphilin-1 isoform X6 [Hypanus sabinus]|uniref:periphilin-1 isoform X6 n=1 Tax=Hypanus sabinus TaxID=79690 RepID=UPI0028C46DCC|nr:periphilin-1 isoform X6 [Hypanus sabinus]